MGKLVSQAEASRIVRARQRRGQTVVFTNGCFDIIHRGHVEYLARAKKLGDVLMIGLNSDQSVKRLKGKGRPLLRFKDRAFILAHLDMVDYVVPFGSFTPRALIAKLLPDVLVKGGDYKIPDIVGAKEVTRSGGKVIVIPLIRGRSTSKILSAVKKL